MVSIIIINYNTYNLTCKCIDSIVNWEKKLDYEIILVDNASKECDPEIFLEKFPSVKMIKSKTNLGFAGGNNLGLQYAIGDYVLLLNSDTILINDAVSLTLEQMKENRAELATCNVLNENGTNQPVCSYFPSVRISALGFLGFIQVARKLWPKKFIYEYDYSKKQKVEWIWGCFFLFKREILSSFSDKKLPADFFMYGEDMQWCYLLKKQGINCWYFPEGKIYHLFSGNKVTQDPYQNKGLQNYILFLKMYYPWWRHSLIFLFEILTTITRFRFKYLFRKINLYFKL